MKVTLDTPGNRERRGCRSGLRWLTCRPRGCEGDHNRPIPTVLRVEARGARFETMSGGLGASNGSAVEPLASDVMAGVDCIGVASACQRAAEIVVLRERPGGRSSGRPAR
jgi:hypothetical protein